MHANARNGGLGLSYMIDEYAAFKVQTIANLISTEEGKRILMSYICFNKKLARNQDMIGNLDRALNHIKIE
jgi:hypothetical protein